MTVNRVQVRDLTARLSSRLVDAIGAESATAAVGRRIGLREDRTRLELLMGQWLAEEISLLNQSRLQRGDGLLNKNDERWLREMAYAETVGLGPLEPYMADPLVEEIDVNSFKSTWVTYGNGRKVDIGQQWDSDDELSAFQNRLTLAMGVIESRLDEQSPSVTLQAPDGSRVVMVLGGSGRNGVSTHPRIAIRRFVIDGVGLIGLAERGLFPEWLIPQLEALLETGMTFLISGGPRSGKTTLLKEMTGVISPMERIVTIEAGGLRELRLEDDPRHPDTVELFTRQANTDGKGEVTSSDHVELTRKMNPDRVLLSELIGGEAVEFLDVASMCQRGSIATIHAHTVDIVFTRLSVYIAKSNAKLAEWAVWSLIADTVDFVIHIDRVKSSRDAVPVRRVTSILEVGGRGTDGGVRSTEVWGLDATGRFVQKAPLEERHIHRLRMEGFPDGLFVPNDGMTP